MTNAPRATLIVVSGMSGSGKSVALRTLEDLGYYCVDNLPAELLTSFVHSMSAAETPRGQLAVSIDVRNVAEDLSRIGQWLTAAWSASAKPQLRCLLLLSHATLTRRRFALVEGSSASTSTEFRR